MTGPFSLSNTGLPQAVQAESRQIELQPVSGAIRKKPQILWRSRHEIIEKFRPNLIRFLRDCWADDSAGVFAPCPQSLHGVQSCLKHTVQSAAPTCMSGSDYLSVCVGEQHWLTVGGQDGQAKPGVAVTTASAFGLSPAIGASTVKTVGECT